MSDWIALGAAAAGLYFVECVVWVDAAVTACFTAPPLGRWRCSSGDALPGNDRGGLAVLDPMNVSGGVVICHHWPFSINADGVTDLTTGSGVDAQTPPRYIRFDDLETVRAEFGDVYINGERFARAGSSALALHLARLIHRVWHSPDSERGAVIESAIDDTLDEKAVTSTRADFCRDTRALRLWCSSLFAFTFVVSPLVLLAIGPYPSWKYLLAGLVVNTAAVAIVHFRAHRAMYPHSSYDRWVNTLSIAALPLAAIRCLDKLSRDSLCQYSAAVVVPTLCLRADATPLLRVQLVDLGQDRFTESREASRAAVRCAQWFQQEVAQKTTAALVRLNIDVWDAPARDDRAMHSYCPRCHAQFGSTATDSCRACARGQLVMFDPEATRAGTGI